MIHLLYQLSYAAIKNWSTLYTIFFFIRSIILPAKTDLRRFKEKLTSCEDSAMFTADLHRFGEEGTP